MLNQVPNPHGAPFYATIAIALFAMDSNAQMVINEYSAANKDAFQTSTEQVVDRGNNISKAHFEDWVEIYNPANNSVSLQGYTLSDNPAKPNKFLIPANIIVPAKGSIVFVCSGKDGYFGNQHHTNFKLSQTKGKETLTLSRNGDIVDSIKVLASKKNHSRGRLTDGNAQWGVFETATPGTQNANAKLRYLIAPAANQDAAFLGGATSVALSTSEANATIVYTVDGSDPAISNTAVAYTAPVQIAKTTALRSCVRPNQGNNTIASPVVTNTYFINENHTLPVISICSGDFGALFQFMKPQMEIAGSMEFFDKNKNRQFKVEGGIKGHGNDSWYYDQKGMRFYVRDEYGEASKIDYPLFHTSDRTKFDCVILRAAGSDNYVGFAGSMASTHVRDGFAQTLAEEGNLNVDTRKYEAVVIYLNGQYWGVYEMRERVDEKFTKAYYDQGKDDVDMLSYYGGISVENEAKNSSAKDDWCALYQYVQNHNMADTAAYNYVASELDVLSLIDYFTLNTFLVNSDWLNWNTAWWRGKKGDGVKWRYKLWDQDNIFNLGQNFSNLPNMDASSANACDVENLNQFKNAGCEQGHVDIFNALMNNGKFHQLYINRYADLLNTTFSRNNMLDNLNGMVADIQPEMQRHSARWEPGNANSYQTWLDNVELLRNQIKARATKVYASMDTCYSVTPVSGIVVNVTPAGAGNVMVNSIQPASYPVSLTYFSNVEVNFASHKLGNYKFSHWLVKSNNAQFSTASFDMSFTQGDTIVAVFVENTNKPVVVRIDTGVSKKPIAINTDLLNGVAHTVPNVVKEDMEEHVLVGAIDKAALETELNTAENTVKNNSYENAPGRVYMDKIVVPSAFTPNGDGNNDVLGVLGASLNEFEFVVYNANGAVVFRTNNQAESWDGSFNSSVCAIGTYVYFVSGTLENGTKVFTNSTFTLLR